MFHLSATVAASYMVTASSSGAIVMQSVDPGCTSGTGGCSSSGGARGEPSTSSRLATGVIPPPPLRARYDLSVVPVGRYVVALGGYTRKGGREFAGASGAY